MLQNKIEHLIVLHGGIKPAERKKLLEELSDCPFDKSKAILATGTYLGEGFDDPRLDTLFLTMPISFKGRLIQFKTIAYQRFFVFTKIYRLCDKI